MAAQLTRCGPGGLRACREAALEWLFLFPGLAAGEQF